MVREVRCTGDRHGRDAGVHLRTPGVPSSYPSPHDGFDANANVTLTAPTTGPTAGFVIMGDRTMPYGHYTGFYNASFTLPTPTANLNGTVYLPNGAFVSWGGNADYRRSVVGSLLSIRSHCMGIRAQ